MRIAIVSITCVVVISVIIAYIIIDIIAIHRNKQWLSMVFECSDPTDQSLVSFATGLQQVSNGWAATT